MASFKTDGDTPKKIPDNISFDTTDLIFDNQIRLLMAVAMITSYPILHFCGRAAFFSITGLDAFPLLTSFQKEKLKKKFDVIQVTTQKYFLIFLNIFHFSYMCLVPDRANVGRFHSKYY